MKELQYPVRPGRYRHFKGNEYQVLGVARHSETEEEMVVYRALYGEGGLWARPAAMWLETVTRDGVTQPRFTYIGECPDQYAAEPARLRSYTAPRTHAAPLSVSQSLPPPHSSSSNTSPCNQPSPAPLLNIF